MRTHNNPTDLVHLLSDAFPEPEEFFAAPLTAKEAEVRLARNALFLSDENRRVWSGLLAQEWFEEIRILAERNPILAQWTAAVEHVAQGRGGAGDVKQVVFYRSAFRLAQSKAGDAATADAIAGALIRLSRYLGPRLRPQHNHFSNGYFSDG